MFCLEKMVRWLGKLSAFQTEIQLKGFEPNISIEIDKFETHLKNI